MRAFRHPSPLPPDPAVTAADSLLHPGRGVAAAGSPLPPDPRTIIAAPGSGASPARENSRHSGGNLPEPAPHG